MNFFFFIIFQSHYSPHDWFRLWVYYVFCFLFYLSSVRLSVFLLSRRKKVTRSIRHPSYCFWHSWRETRRGGRRDWERGRRILGSPTESHESDNLSLCLFKRVSVTDREEHCLKLVTGGDDVSPPGFFLSRRSKAGLKNGETLSMFTKNSLQISSCFTRIMTCFMFLRFFTVLVLDVTWLKVSLTNEL